MTTCGTAQRAECIMWCQHWPGIAKNDTMRANMTMSNAQAALLAAANSAVRGSAHPIEPVLKRAAAYLQWLDGQDAAPAAVAISQRHYDEQHKPKPITQCKTVSGTGIHCLLAEGHALPHRNSQDGVKWNDPVEKPVAVVPPAPVVHFYTGFDSAYAPCGIFMHNETAVTTAMADVTCTRCREALGL